MAAANGFTLVRPDTRYGDNEYTFANTEMIAQKFTAQGSGSISVNELGMWGKQTTSSTKVRLALFEHDAANACPGPIVSDSDTGEITVGTGGEHIIYFTFSTLPALTGGSSYWVGMMGSLANWVISVFTSGGVSGYLAGMTYGTWPTDAQWHGQTDGADDHSFYIVYTAGGGGGITLPLFHAIEKR
jgi:hypothetical protein